MSYYSLPDHIMDVDDPEGSRIIFENLVKACWDRNFYTGFRLFLCLLFVLLFGCLACGMLVPQPGAESGLRQ